MPFSFPTTWAKAMCVNTEKKSSIELWSGIETQKTIFIAQSGFVFAAGSERMK